MMFKEFWKEVFYGDVYDDKEEAEEMKDNRFQARSSYFEEYEKEQKRQERCEKIKKKLGFGAAIVCVGLLIGYSYLNSDEYKEKQKTEAGYMDVTPNTPSSDRHVDNTNENKMDYSPDSPRPTSTPDSTSTPVLETPPEPEEIQVPEPPIPTPPDPGMPENPNKVKGDNPSDSAVYQGHATVAGGENLEDEEELKIKADRQILYAEAELISARIDRYILDHPSVDNMSEEERADFAEMVKEYGDKVEEILDFNADHPSQLSYRDDDDLPSKRGLEDPVSPSRPSNADVTY